MHEIEEAGEADDESVDFAESFEAEDFGCVVAVVVLDLMGKGVEKGPLRNGGVVEWPIDAEEANVRVGGPFVGEDTEHANGCGSGDEGGEDGGGGEVV